MKIKSLLLIPLLTLTLNGGEEQIKLNIALLDNIHVTFWARTAETNWGVYAAPGLLGPWTLVHHVTQPPEQMTHAFTYYRCNPFNTNDCIPQQFFYAKTLVP